MGNLAILAATGTSVLDETTRAVIQSGFDSVTATVTDVVGIAVVASVGVICLTAGVAYALKKVKGVLHSAA